MIIKDTWAGDLALIELLAGKTEAPAGVLEKLESRGHVRLDRGGTPSLSAEGRTRAQALKSCEHELRLMYAAKDRAALTGDGSSVLRVGGGAVTIRF